MKTLFNRIRSFIALQVLAVHCWLDVQSNEPKQPAEILSVYADEILRPEEGTPTEDTSLFVLCVGEDKPSGTIGLQRTDYFYVKDPLAPITPENVIQIINGQVFDQDSMDVKPILGKAEAERIKLETFSQKRFSSVYYFEVPYLGVK